MNEAKKKLSEISSVLFREEVTYGEIFETVKDYKSLLEKATSINFEDSQTSENIFTEAGKAIGPKWAGLCVDDVFRTQKFCKGLLKAVYEKQKDKPSKKIQILYAGTGPFATLALPLVTIFSPDEISFTFLEINKLSFKGLQETISYFGIENYISELHHCDATTYKVNPEKHIDIVVIETMMSSLKGEHQVAITFNLINQLPKNVLLIPEDVSLHVLAVNSERRFANKISSEQPITYFKKLGTLFTLNKSEILKHSDKYFKEFPNYEFPEKKILIPRKLVQNFDELHVETSITIFKDEILKIDESGLTTLDNFHLFRSMMTPSKYLVSTYMCGQKPGLYFNFKN